MKIIPILFVLLFLSGCSWWDKPEVEHPPGAMILDEGGRPFPPAVTRDESYWVRELARARARIDEAKKVLNVAQDDEVWAWLKLRELQTD